MCNFSANWSSILLCNTYINYSINILGRSQCPHRLKRGSVVTHLSEIAGSNPAEGMDVCLLWMLCVVR